MEERVKVVLQTELPAAQPLLDQANLMWVQTKDTVGQMIADIARIGELHARVTNEEFAFLDKRRARLLQDEKEEEEIRRARRERLAREAKEEEEERRRLFEAEASSMEQLVLKKREWRDTLARIDMSPHSDPRRLGSPASSPLPLQLGTSS